MSTTDLSGHEDIEVDATLNGKPLRRRVKARQHLADFLRQELELTGTHLGCEHGICGACTVLIDGRTARGCLTLAAQISGKSVETIEGLTENGMLADLQKEFIERNAAQCGFCSSGMLLTAHELLLSGETSVARRYPRSHVRQHVPLHRLSRHHRRRGSGDDNARPPLMAQFPFPPPPPPRPPASVRASRGGS